jgi:ABC-type nitrate/sulfonate/bicarbonate transport system permease component
VIIVALVGVVLTESVVFLERYLSRWRTSERERL